MNRSTQTQSDRAAHLTQVMNTVAPDLLVYFERRVPPDDAPDLVAETMMTAWRRLAVAPSDVVEARMWLFGIARNVLNNANRGARRRTRLADRLRELRQDSDDFAPPADVGAEVRDAIDRLPPESADLIRLVHWEGMTLAQAADVVAISASTAQRRYLSAKAALRAALMIETTVS